MSRQGGMVFLRNHSGLHLVQPLSYALRGIEPCWASSLCTVSTVNLSVASLQPHSAFRQGIFLNVRVPDLTSLDFGLKVPLETCERYRLLCLGSFCSGSED